MLGTPGDLVPMGNYVCARVRAYARVRVGIKNSGLLLRIIFAMALCERSGHLLLLPAPLLFCFEGTTMQVDKRRALRLRRLEA
jgi:hypothetical protein